MASTNDWRKDLRACLEKWVRKNGAGNNDTQRSDTAVIECTMALCSAYYTTQRVISGRLTDDERNGIADMLFGLTAGLSMGNPFFAKMQPVIIPLLAMTNTKLVLASQYLDDEIKQGGQNNPATADLRRRAVECMSAVFDIPLYLLQLHLGETFVRDNGVAIRAELEKILVP
jgi:hypothetical protein